MCLPWTWWNGHERHPSAVNFVCRLSSKRCRSRNTSKVHHWKARFDTVLFWMFLSRCPTWMWQFVKKEIIINTDLVLTWLCHAPPQHPPLPLMLHSRTSTERFVIVWSTVLSTPRGHGRYGTPFYNLTANFWYICIANWIFDMNIQFIISVVQLFKSQIQFLTPVNQISYYVRITNPNLW